MIELFLWCFAGIFFGAACGLLPGIHSNSVCAFVLGFAAFGEFGFVVFIVAMSVAQSFFDFIPNALVGAPDSDNFLHALPAHRMYLEGKALAAIQLSCFGCLFGAVFALLLSPLLVSLASDLEPVFPQAFCILLALLSVSMVASERVPKKIVPACAVSCSAAMLGLLFLEKSPNSILCLVSGFFAVPVLAESIFFAKKAGVSQSLSGAKIKGKGFFASSLLGSVSGALVSVVPSIGPSQAAFLAGKIFGRPGKTGDYLALLGAISSSNTIFAFFVLYFFAKPRSGSSIAIQQLYLLSWHSFLVLAGFAMFCAGLSFLLCIALSPRAVSFVQGLDSKTASCCVLFFVSASALAFGGLHGFVLFLCSAGIGCASNSLNLKRAHLMNFLSAPTIAYYFWLLF